MSERFAYFAPCARGLESLLADELRSLGLKSVRPQRSGVLFAGPLTHAYRAMLWSRIASRVLLTLAEVPAGDSDSLYEAVKALPWEDHLRASGSLVVDASGINDALRNTQFTAVRVKDAICDRFREREGRRPDVVPDDPDVRVNIAVRSTRATVSLDLSGAPLHRRGYRTPGVQGVAPLKETLAAAVLAFAGWPEVAAQGGAFVDPLCGSGTLAIEAAMIAGDMAPGLLRSSWGFDRWLGHDSATWGRLIDAADDRSEKGRASIPRILGFDHDARAVQIATECANAAGLGRNIEFSQAPLSLLVPPQDAVSGLVAVNPPWGERLSDRAELPALYRELSARLVAGFAGWRLAAITPDERLARGVGLDPVRTMRTTSGPIETAISVFDVGAAAAPVSLSESASAFENRLTKMVRHVGKWARRTGTTCYRVYDADLPDYAVAIDVYEGAGSFSGRRWAHVAEYAPPNDVDPARAMDRLADVVAVVPRVLELAPADVFLKRRERQRGTAQYERQGGSGVVVTVVENGLIFEVNLSDYLDTGLFLDHRDTRAWIRERARGNRFLNLFAYTGTASVYAAAGGARTTTTVDLSATYCDWAQRNLELNGFSGSRHKVDRYDVLEWIKRAKARKERYDFVFCDPPTFSNSKRMDTTWDIQRDHGELLADLADILSDDGTVLFSCNRRRFKLDEERLAAAGLKARDVTKRTIPKDFERTPWVHACWEIRRAGAGG